MHSAAEEEEEQHQQQAIYSKARTGRWVMDKKQRPKGVVLLACTNIL